jgi:hypothetical protein
MGQHSRERLQAVRASLRASQAYVHFCRAYSVLCAFMFRYVITYQLDIALRISLWGGGPARSLRQVFLLVFPILHQPVTFLQQYVIRQCDIFATLIDFLHLERTFCLHLGLGAPMILRG